MTIPLPDPTRIERPEPVAEWRVDPGETASAHPLFVAARGVGAARRLAVEQTGQQINLVPDQIDNLVAALLAARAWKDPALVTGTDGVPLQHARTSGALGSPEHS